MSQEWRAAIKRVRKAYWWRGAKFAHRVRRATGIAQVHAEREIVIGLGLHRTGTRSLSVYLERIGLRTVHWPWWCEKEAARYVDDPGNLVGILEPLLFLYDGFTDVPFPGLYRCLDQRFPRARFILIERDADKWWRSICRHWELDKGPHSLTPFEVVQYRACQLPVPDRVSCDDEEAHKRRLENYVCNVKAYFEDRPGKLLTVDLEDRRINEAISAFLNRSVAEYPVEKSEKWI